MFELTDQPATLAHLNVRTEKIGDDERPAADLKIEFDASNDMLIHFGPQLRSSLFAKAAAGKSKAAQGELDVVAPISDLPHLRCTEIDPPIRLAFEGVGYRGEIDYGIGQPITLADLKVNAVRIEPREGGTVSFKLRLQASNPDASAIGKLAQLLGHEITLTLTPPAADERIAA